MFNLLKVLILFFVFFSGSVSASEIALDISKPQYHIGKSVNYLEETDNQLDLNTVSYLPESSFKPVGSAVFERSFTSSTFYFRFRLVNHEEEPVRRLLVFEMPWLDSIKVRIESPSGRVDKYKTGDAYRFENRAVESRFPNIEHNFATGISTVYLEVKSHDPFVVPISVLDRESLLQKQAEDSTVTGFVYGMIFVMILYHLVIFIIIRLNYYGFYVLYLMLFLLMNAAYNGYTFELFWNDYPTVQNWMLSFTIFAFSIAGLFFYRSFLSLKNTIPWAHKVVNTMIVMFLIIYVITLLSGYSYHILVAIILALVFGFYCLLVSWLSFLKGNFSSRFVLFGKILAMTGGVITVLSITAVMPYTVLGFRAIEFSMVLDSILLAFALIDRVKENEKERHIAEVSARTDPLTSLMNRRAYDEVCHQMTGDMKGTDVVLSAMMLDIDHFKQVNDTYGHQAGDVVLQRVARIIKNSVKESDYVFRLGGEEFLVLFPGTGKEMARISAERIRAIVEKTNIQVADQEIKVSVSIGICEYKSYHSTISQVEHMADKALYVAKQTGRNRVIVAP
ncbi:sensor domain-containing diguanylate cyclase [Thiomicrorhabdus sp. ZW0627]|nr:sensor domain-containing diguanylate cyclase [Thiomicrorhabdus sp. ZW0627]